jgi:hypothetical protein
LAEDVVDDEIQETKPDFAEVEIEKANTPNISQGDSAFAN